MASIEQSALSIIETVARAESKGKDIYVTEKGKVKVQEGLAGWWAGRKIKHGSTTQWAHNQRAVELFKGALAREKQSASVAASSRVQSAFARLTNSSGASGSYDSRLSASSLVNIRDFFVRSQGNESGPDLFYASTKIVESLKAGSYDFNTQASAENIDSHLGALKIEQDLQVLAKAAENLHTEIDALHASAENAGIPVDAARLSYFLNELTQVNGAGKLLLHVAEQQAAAESGRAMQEPPPALSAYADVISEKTSGQVVTDILNDKDGRLSAIEEKAGVRLSELGEDKRVHFENLLNIYADAETEVAKSSFVLDVERRQNPDVEPDPTAWRGQVVNDDAAKNILRFLAQNHVNDAFFDEAASEVQRGGEVLHTLLEVGSKPLDTLTETDYETFTQALQEYVHLVGGNGSLQNYLRLGSDEETPQAPEALKERLRESLQARVGVEESRAALLAILSQDTLLNVLRGKAQQFGDTKYDPYDLAKRDYNALTQINTVNQKLLTDLLGNVTSAISNSVDGFVPGGNEALSEFIEGQTTQHAKAQQSIDSVLKPYSEVVLDTLNETTRADHFDRLSNPDFEFDEVQKQNYESLILLNLGLNGQLRAGDRQEFPSPNVITQDLGRKSEPALRYSFDLPPGQKASVAQSVAALVSQGGSGPNETADASTITPADLKADLAQQLKTTSGPHVNLNEQQLTTVANRLAGLVSSPALEQAKNNLLGSAIGSFQGNAETFQLETVNQPPQVVLAVVDGRVEINLSQYGDLQTLNIQSSGVAVPPGSQKRSEDVIAAPAGVVQKLSVSVSLDELLQDQVTINSEDVDVSVDVWVPDSAYYI